MIDNNDFTECDHGVEEAECAICVLQSERDALAAKLELIDGARTGLLVPESICPLLAEAIDRSANASLEHLIAIKQAEALESLLEMIPEGSCDFGCGADARKMANRLRLKAKEL